MPALVPTDALLLTLSTSTSSAIAAWPNGGRYPMPIEALLRQVTSDRLSMAGDYLRSADHLIAIADFRSSISRNYYAMYHAARAVVFAHVRGDEHNRHNELPTHLPADFPDRVDSEAALNAARLLRNEADYNAYPASSADWQPDAVLLSVTAAEFVATCENYAIMEGYV